MAEWLERWVLGTVRGLIPLVAWRKVRGHHTWDKVDAGSQKWSLSAGKQIFFARLHAIEKHILVGGSPLFKIVE